MDKTKTYVGLDVGKTSIFYAFPDRCGEFSNTAAGIGSFLAQLDKSCHCVMESTGLYHYPLAYAIADSGLALSIVNPLVSHGFSQSFLSISKTDHSDAALLRRLGEERQLSSTILPSKAHQAFRHRLVMWQNLRQDMRRLENRLADLSFHPCPDAESLALLEEELALLQSHHQKIEELLEQDLPECHEQHIEQAMSIKGIGKKTALFLVLFTQGLQEFDSAKALAKYVGIAPQVYQSGKIKKRGRIAKKGNPTLRYLRYNCAKSAKRYNTACKDLYERLRTKGKPHKVAMVAVMHKLLRQFFAVIKNGTNYQDEYHLAH